jgi:hypothetical protein
MATNEDQKFASDLLKGADEIAQFLFGSSKEKRRIYHLAAKGELPCFHIGSLLFARRSTLEAWVLQKEGMAKN